MKPVKSVRDVIALLQGQHQSTSLTLWTAQEKVKCVNTFPTIKTKLND